MTKQINLFYTSDVHGHVLPIEYGTNEPANHGLVKYVTAVKAARAKDAELIVLDNGDLIQGTPFMTHYVKAHHEHQPNPVIALMNQVKLDAAVIGNHEFNFGPSVLGDAIKESTFPWLAANILNEQTGEPYFGTPYLIKELAGGVKVAIIGVTTHYIPNWEAPQHIAGLKFADAFLTLKQWVDYLHATEQPDVLIASYHGGFERDLMTGEPTEPLTGENQAYRMCSEIPGIDVLLTGHQHRELVETVNGVLVVQPGKNSEKYGQINVTLAKTSDGWEVTEKQATLEAVAAYQPDAKAVQLVEQLEVATQHWLDQPIGEIVGDMQITDPFQARIRKHPFIEFIQHVQMEAAGVDISVASLFNNDSDGFASEVTMRDVVSNYMYPNTLVVLALPGKAIRAALEQSATYFILDEQGELAVNPVYLAPKVQHYNYDMWEGINYTIRVSNPVGARIEGLTYHGQPLEDETIYHVALNNYRAGGGGDFPMFKDQPIVKDTQTDTVELIRAYFEKYPRVHATTTANFTVEK